LAGGLNLYGFADGDPVNFSDPFGLMPCCSAADMEQAMLGVGRRLQPIQGPLEVAGLLAVAPLTISGEAAGLATLGIRQTFYRGIGGAEAADFAATGALRAGGGNEGKYLTNSIEAAAKWAGQKGNGPGSQILRIRVPQDAVRTFDRLGRIDGIGEAWWAPMQSLNGARVDVVRTIGVPR
jgi:hypothetical protein